MSALPQRHFPLTTDACEEPSPEFLADIRAAEPELRRYAAWLCRQDAEAKDLYQNTVLRALERWCGYTPGTNIKAWMTTIMYRLFVGEHRRRTRATEHLRRYLEQPRPDRSDPEAACRDNLAFIDALLGGLSSQSRRMILMLAQGFRYREIAEQFGVPVGTVKGRVHVARRRLRARYSRMGVQALATGA